ncbi:MAG TPA: M15 family metallopeptidase [Candidatus Binatus sp.]|nr:M15 family metallopeptidase [Candidatus Binatus sp.]
MRNEALPSLNLTASRPESLLAPRKLAFAVAAILLSFLSGPLSAQAPSPLASSPKPPAAPARWKGLIGEYGPEDKPIFILEKDGYLTFLSPPSPELRLEQLDLGLFTISSSDTLINLRFDLDTNSVAASLHFGKKEFPRRKEGPDQGQVFRITPQHPVEELRTQALADSPPQEGGPFRKPELVELTTLDPAIHLDIRYATTNDFLGTPVYTQARAFLQRPAAESLVRALHKLQLLGYGLLIHDAYRPWYVTKIFWDATPAEGKIFVADPKEGSRHNRGCAVDLTLYDLGTGKPIEMPGTYDEMSPRSFPDYPGGTSLQRWHRDLLRRAMESEGFTVYEHEWWHFDYKDWREYPILNIKFEDLHSGQGLASAR